MNPLDPDIVFVAALGHIWGSNPERGLYRTTDGGDTWELVKFISDKAGFVDVAFRPGEPDTLFAASWERVRGPWFLNSGGPGSALWKSTDGGTTWTEVSGNGFPTAMKGRIGIAISESNPDVMYTMVEAEEEEDGSGGNGLYRSADGGDSVGEGERRQHAALLLLAGARRPARPRPRLLLVHAGPVSPNDGGRTAGNTTNGIHVDHHAMWIDPVDPERIVVGNDGGVAITYDKGGNWRYLNTMALGQFYDISYNMDKPYRVCGGLQDNGTWCGPSRLVVGARSPSTTGPTISGGDGFVTAQDPEDPNLVWAESQGGNMRRLNLATRQSNGLRRPNWEDGWRPLQDSASCCCSTPEPRRTIRGWWRSGSRRPRTRLNQRHALELEHALLPVGARPQPLLRGRQPGGEEHEPGGRPQDHLAGPLATPTPRRSTSARVPPAASPPT